MMFCFKIAFCNYALLRVSHELSRCTSCETGSFAAGRGGIELLSRGHHYLPNTAQTSKRKKKTWHSMRTANMWFNLLSLKTLYCLLRLISSGTWIPILCYQPLMLAVALNFHDLRKWTENRKYSIAQLFKGPAIFDVITELTVIPRLEFFFRISVKTNR